MPPRRMDAIVAAAADKSLLRVATELVITWDQLAVRMVTTMFAMCLAISVLSASFSMGMIALYMHSGYWTAIPFAAVFLFFAVLTLDQARYIQGDTSSRARAHARALGVREPDW